MITAEKTEAVCIGRLVLDLPLGFVPILPIEGAFGDASRGVEDTPIDVSVRAKGTTAASFADAALKRRNEIVAFSDDTTDILREVISSANSTLFRIQRIKESYTSEVHFMKGDFRLVAEAKSYEGQFHQAEARLAAFITSVAVTNPSEENHTGFCLGPVTVGGVNNLESASLLFRSAERPDVTIKIDIDTYARDEPVSLLHRMGGPNSLLRIFDVRNSVLREGELTVAGMRAQEWLGSVKLGENRDEKQFGFALETRRSKSSDTSPRLHIELDSGQNDQSGKKRPNSLTDEQAMQLWDTIIKSVRLRSEPKRN